MNRLFVTLLVALAATAPSSAQRAVTPSAADLITAASTLTVETGSASTVARMSFQREAATYDLQSGTVAFIRDATGRTLGLVFKGTGRVRFDPPDVIEQEHLRRFVDATRLDIQITDLVVLAADSLPEQLRALHPPAASISTDPHNKVLRSALRMLGDDDRIDDMSWLKTILERRSGELFWSYLVPTKGADLVIGVDPWSAEEVYLERVNRGFFAYVAERDGISMFHRQKDLLRPEEDRNEPLKFVRMDRLTLDGSFETQTFKSELSFRASATMVVRSLLDRQRWVPFLLHPDLVVDSVMLAGDTPLRWHRWEDSYVVWVELDTLLRSGSQRSFRIVYHGDLIERSPDGSSYAKTSWAWFPRCSQGDKASYDLTFRYPERFTLVSSGERTSLATDDGVTVSHWVTRRPARNMSFAIDVYETHEVTDPRIPPITVHMSRSSSSGFTISGSDPIEQVGADIANSVFFFQNLFGTLPMNRLNVADIPYGHGEAFPGLIHLSWMTFQGMSEHGADELFRSHETAHQWWGIGVQPATYHDRWLSEGLSEYCALWYLQSIDDNNKLFAETLERWQESILSARKYLLSDGVESAPIWLGYRTETSETQGDYSRVVYHKGAWVVHMLRNLLLDLNSMNEDLFRRVLRDLYSTHAGRTVSTNDLIASVQRTAGIDITWFINQWVKQGRVPSYQFAYKIEPTAERMFKVRCRVRQENVDPDFQMYIPVRFDFGGGKLARTRILVKGPVTEVEIPPLPMRPTSVTFNDLWSVLCEWEEESW